MCMGYLFGMAIVNRAPFRDLDKIFFELKDNGNQEDQTVVTCQNNAKIRQDSDRPVEARQTC